MAWTGFTDEQLSALKRQDEETHAPSIRGRSQGQRGRGRGSGPNRGRGRALPNQSGQRHEPVNEDQMLSRPKASGPKGKPILREEHSVWRELKEPTPARPPPARRKPPSTTVNELPGGNTTPTEGTETGGEGGKEEQKPEEKEKEENMKILDENEGHERELSKLEEFQKMQKHMEEENAKKKSLLARAIADRKKKTAAEAKRLAYIQKELAKIENLLTNDVNILRDKIELASRDFNDAQRRYQKAETEFVAAKMHLHKASEMKEALTEHLCTIIHENELRKSKKLEELVSKLDVESLDEFENIPENTSNPTSPISTTPGTAEMIQSAASAPQENIQSASQSDSTACDRNAQNSSQQLMQNIPHQIGVVGNPSNVHQTDIVEDQPSGENMPQTRTTAGNDSGNMSLGNPGDVQNSNVGFGNGTNKDDSSIGEIGPSVTQGQGNDEGDRDIPKDTVKTNNEAECTNEQPEAEQHVEMSVNQT